MRGKVQRVARPVQTQQQNSSVTGPKFAIFFTKFLSDVELSSSVLTRASVLRCFQPLWYARAQDEGMPLFLSIGVKNPLP